MSLTNFYSMTKRTLSRRQKTPKSRRKRPAIDGDRSPLYPRSPGDMLGSQVMALSQSESEPEVRWDNNSPSPRRIMQLTRLKPNGPGADLSDIVKRLACGDDEISPSPPLLGLWMDKTGPSGVQRTIASPVHVRPPVRKSRRRGVGGLSAEAEQELRRLAAGLNNPVRNRYENGDKEEPPKASASCSTADGVPMTQRISQYSSQGGDIPESFTLFDEPTQHTDSSSQRSETRLSQASTQKLSEIIKEEEQSDANTEDSLLALWEDDDLFENDSFVRIATQLPTGAEPDFKSPPRSSKRKSLATSTPLPTKHARYDTTGREASRGAMGQERRSAGKCLSKEESKTRKSLQSPAYPRDQGVQHGCIAGMTLLKEKAREEDCRQKKECRTVSGVTESFESVVGLRDNCQNTGHRAMGPYNGPNQGQNSNKTAMVTRSNAHRFGNGKTMQANQNKPNVDSSGKYNFKPSLRPSDRGSKVAGKAPGRVNNSSNWSTTSGRCNLATNESLKNNVAHSVPRQVVNVPTTTTSLVQAVVSNDTELCDTSIPDDILLCLAEPDDFFDTPGTSSSSSTFPTQLLPSPKTAPVAPPSKKPGLLANKGNTQNATASNTSSYGTQNNYRFTKLRPGATPQATCTSTTATITPRNNNTSRPTFTNTTTSVAVRAVHTSLSKKPASVSVATTVPSKSTSVSTGTTYPTISKRGVSVPVATIVPSTSVSTGTTYSSMSKRGVSVPLTNTATSSKSFSSKVQSKPYIQTRAVSPAVTGPLHGSSRLPRGRSTSECEKTVRDGGGLKEDFPSGDDDDLLLQAVLSQEGLQGGAKPLPPVAEDPPTQCSPEEIERKKQQAMERRKKKLQLGTQVQAAAPPPRRNPASNRLQRSKSCNVLTSSSGAQNSSSNGRRHNVPSMSQRNTKR
ncbi:uncharacterized protein [Branchiostoma lanceolatum]|uniref:uncharacterized protein n=1 Tax=Branchiostoma lanceolatum TaxID=7740 RepID=UPI0034551F34